MRSLVTRVRPTVALGVFALFGICLYALTYAANDVALVAATGISMTIKDIVANEAKDEEMV